MSGNIAFRSARWMAKQARRMGADRAECDRIEADTRAHVVALLARGCPADAVRVRYVLDPRSGALVVTVDPAEGVSIAPEVRH